MRGIGLAVPGPVDFASATVVSPPIMTGWDGYPIRSWFAPRFDCPVLVDNDANAMALGEHAREFTDRDSLVMVKVATGIGAGIIAHGLDLPRRRRRRGRHRPHPDQPAGRPRASADPPVCRCGNVGCIEAYAGGWALIRDLRGGGRDVAAIAGHRAI